MDTKHTPGPWHVEHPFQEPGVYVSAPSTALIAKVYDEDAEANAQLIASAPDLLSALIGLADCAGITALDGYKSELDNAMRIARAAIEKASVATHV